MLSNLAMLPFIIYYLDGDMLGLWYVYVSIGAVAMLFDFGFNLTFSRNITYCWGGASDLKKENVVFSESNLPNFRLMRSVLAACKRVYMRIAGSALLLMLTIGTFYIVYISRQVEGCQHLWAWIIYSVAVFLNLYYGYYASFLRGVGAITDANKNVVIARSAQILTTILLLMSGTGIIGASVAYLVYGTTFRFLGKYKFYRYKDIGPQLNKVVVKVSKKEINRLINVVWHNAWRDGVISMTMFLCNQASTIICSLYLTLTETGIYSVGVQIAMAVSAISGTLYMALQPQLQAAYINNDKELVKDTMSLIIASLLSLFFIGFVASVTIVPPLLRLLKPESVIPVSVLTGLCFYHFILQFRNVFTSYFSSTNRIIYMKSFVASAIFCVVLSVIFTGYFNMGMWGLVCAQIISQLIYNVWHWPILVSKEIETSIAELILRGEGIFMKNIKQYAQWKQM